MPVLSPVHMQAQQQRQQQKQLHQPSRFEDVWNAFQEKIQAKAGKHASLERRVQCLEAVTNVLFGLDSSKKETATRHGCFELILSLSADKDEEYYARRLQLPTLKAFKSALVNNPDGRDKCRAMGVMEFLADIAETRRRSLSTTPSPPSDPTTAIVEEEFWTTLAAMCLSHELNSLEATMKFASNLQSSRDSFPAEKYTSLESKRMYLTALFDVMNKQEVQLVEYLKKEEQGDKFWKQIEQGERLLLLNSSNEDDLTACIGALKPTLALTDLTHNLYVDLVERRHRKVRRASPALADLDHLLFVAEGGKWDSELRMRVVKLKEKVLHQQKNKLTKTP